jgi:hypothetical protein
VFTSSDSFPLRKLQPPRVNKSLDSPNGKRPISGLWRVATGDPSQPRQCRHSRSVALCRRDAGLRAGRLGSGGHGGGGPAPGWRTTSRAAIARSGPWGTPGRATWGRSLLCVGRDPQWPGTGGTCSPYQPTQRPRPE